MGTESRAWARQEHVAKLLPSMVRHRRHLHTHPEIGLALPRTHAYVVDAVRSLGYEPEVRDGSGVTVSIEGSSRLGPTRVLRADMDALPLQENSGLSFSSKVAGAMHACGHDLHTAMLLGAAELFASHRPVHDVVLAFQPGEESDRGALRVLRHDNLRLSDDTVAFAIHVNALLPSGIVTSRVGTFMAHGDWFRVSFGGRGGHASAPHLAANPIDGMADWVQGLCDLVHELSRDEPVVATVTESSAGNTVNVIPATGSMRGTMRTLSDSQRSLLHTRMGALTTLVAERFALESAFEISPGYPAVVNNADYLGALLAALDEEHPEPPFQTMAQPSMVIEDFAYFLHRWRGAMVYLGAQVGNRESFNHSDDVMFDEEAMTIGLALHSLVADLPL